MVAMSAGSHNVCPGMRTPHVTGDYVVNGQIEGMFSAILAGIIIATEHFAARKFENWARPVHHQVQSDDRGTRERLACGVNLSPTIEDQQGFIRQD